MIPCRASETPGERGVSRKVDRLRPAKFPRRRVAPARRSFVRSDGGAVSQWDCAVRPGGYRADSLPHHHHRRRATPDPPRDRRQPGKNTGRSTTERLAQLVASIGEPWWIRTTDPQLKRLVLYP